VSLTRRCQRVSAGANCARSVTHPDLLPPFTTPSSLPNPSPPTITSHRVARSPTHGADTTPVAPAYACSPGRHSDDAARAHAGLPGATCHPLHVAPAPSQRRQQQWTRPNIRPPRGHQHGRPWPARDHGRASNSTAAAAAAAAAAGRRQQQHQTRPAEGGPLCLQHHPGPRHVHPAGAPPRARRAPRAAAALRDGANDGVAWQRRAPRAVPRVRAAQRLPGVC
jgi:hypothetical protein